LAEIVNLRLARKRALRRDDAEKADANRTAFGLPRALRDKAERESQQAARALDGVRRSDEAVAVGDAGSRASPPADEPS
jgi:hypothetical protein